MYTTQEGVVTDVHGHVEAQTAPQPDGAARRRVRAHGRLHARLAAAPRVRARARPRRAHWRTRDGQRDGRRLVRPGEPCNILINCCVLFI